PLLDAVLAVNGTQNTWVVDTLRGQIDPASSSVAVLGLTYTAGTSTLRRAASLEVIAALRAAGATVKAYDPRADFSELPGGVDFEVCERALDAVRDCDAAVILTPWPEFADLDLREIASAM